METKQLIEFEFEWNGYMEFLEYEDSKFRTAVRMVALWCIIKFIRTQGVYVHLQEGEPVSVHKTRSTRISDEIERRINKEIVSEAL